MKKIIPLLLLPFLLLNCNKDDVELFRMDYRENFEIQGGLSAFFQWQFEVNNINTRKSTYLTTHSVGEAEITSINPQSARLTSVSGIDFRFIKCISIRIYEDDPTQYREIFYRDNIPFNIGSTLDLLPTLINAKIELLEEEFNILVNMEYRDQTPQTIEVVMDLEFAAR